MAQQILDPHYLTVDRTFQQCQDNFDELYGMTSNTTVIIGVQVQDNPTQGNLTNDIGMTPAVAGVGYTCVIRYEQGADSKMMQVISDGANWYYFVSNNSI